MPATFDINNFLTKPKTSYHRPPLPSTCTDFTSEEGKKLFAESLQEGNANLYFKLSSQLITQHEPAFCGVTTLVTVINTLDPDRIWRSAWTNRNNTLLEDNGSLADVRKLGMHLGQFISLAKYNGLDAEVTFAANNHESVEQFRRDLIKSVRSDDTVLAPNFDRKELKQDGWGHFSPLAAYHSGTDQVLVLDVARYKYPPYWVSLKLLHKSMVALDYVTRDPRGYVTLRLTKK